MSGSGLRVAGNFFRGRRTLAPESDILHRALSLVFLRISRRQTFRPLHAPLEKPLRHGQEEKTATSAQLKPEVQFGSPTAKAISAFNAPSVPKNLSSLGHLFSYIAAVIIVNPVLLIER